ncbi:hypothetical protein P152DRAFT_98872 [Eremomyces bilateralis CBS 781.70]|uniref:Uncharacterized protein n=1 Tax=Eremomyces bilateralis CBS 781.70 TaxID=1392243 RepID=A0A6G1FXP2_9PEZI|nr:uncharacterized protein P152DRAFT_98872 [Eremomyces bilateralis CBS 781.70]KAF1810451.1 hypothetical protein P152DRAFT_98872 [Eremomyces bilateralis CBS 781.70]
MPEIDPFTSFGVVLTSLLVTMSSNLCCHHLVRGTSNLFHEILEALEIGGMRPRETSSLRSLSTTRLEGYLICTVRINPRSGRNDPSSIVPVLLTTAYVHLISPMIPQNSPHRHPTGPSRPIHPRRFNR